MICRWLAGFMAIVVLAGCELPPSAKVPATATVTAGPGSNGAAAPAGPEVFVPMAVSKPSDILKAMENTGGSFGGIGCFGQTFTTTAAGELTELHIRFASRLGTNSNSDYFVELFTTASNENWERAEILATLRLPYSALPAASPMEMPFTTIDMRPYHVIVKAGQALAFSVRREDERKENLGCMIVNRPSYKGGRGFTRFHREDPWNPQSYCFQFRAFVDRTVTTVAAPTTEPEHATTRPAGAAPVGELTAEAVAITQQEYRRQMTAATRPAEENPELQGRVLVGQQRGCWITEVHLFNASSQTRRYQRTPQSITLTAAGERRGTVINPAPAAASGFGTPVEQGMLGTNEGTIHMFVIWDRPEALKAGSYHLTVVLPAETLGHTLETDFVVPAAAAPAAK